MDLGDDLTWPCLNLQKISSKGKPIEVFNKGKHERDFTYVDDIVNGIFNIIINKKSKFGAKIFNIGNGKKIKLLKIYSVN